MGAMKKNNIFVSILSSVITFIVLGFIVSSAIPLFFFGEEMDTFTKIFLVCFFGIALIILIATIRNIVKVVKATKNINSNAPTPPTNARQGCPTDMDRYRRGLVDDDIQRMQEQGIDPSTQTVVCPKCGYINKKTDKRCTLCGNTLKKD